MEARYDPLTGQYVYTDAQPVRSIEPAFLRQAITTIDPMLGGTPELKPEPGRTTTFADAYPKGSHGALSLAPVLESEPEDDWRMPGSVADDILISLPEGTPRMVRTLLTIILGGMRRG